MLTGDSIAHVDVMVDSAAPHGPTMPAFVVMVQFNAAGARILEEVTAASVHRKLAIVLDDVVLSCPKIQSAIPGGRAQIALTPGHVEDTQTVADGLSPGRALEGDWHVEHAVVVPPDF